jgi:RimJ/RimL family protein N-acetyltransferase
MIELAPFTPGDCDTLLGWIPDERFLRQWAGRPFVHPLDRSQLEAHLANASDARPFRVNHAGSGEMIGYAELSAIDLQHRTARFSRLLIGPNERGAGLGGALVRALLAVAFEELGLQRVELGVFDWNTPALRCYEAVGFRHEGVRRQSIRYRDEYWDSCSMSLLASEYRC